MNTKLKEDYLQQNAFHEVDQYCSPEKQVLMLRNIFDLYDKMRELHEGGVELEQITNLDTFDKIARMKYEETTDNLKTLADEISKMTIDQFEVIQV